MPYSIPTQFESHQRECYWAMLARQVRGSQMMFGISPVYKATLPNAERGTRPNTQKP